MNSTRPYHEGESQSGYSKRPKPFDVNSRADAGRNPAPHNALRSSVMQKYTIAWICALPLELAASRAMLDEEHEAPVIPASDNNQYVLGHIGHQNIVMTCLPRQYGNNNAALVATDLKRSFPGVIVSLKVGIGGGSPSMADLYLGDVVVRTRVMQYDLGKILSAGWFQSTADPKIPSSRLRSTITGTKIAEALLQGGSDPDEKDARGSRPLEIALKIKRWELAGSNGLRAGYEGFVRHLLNKGSAIDLKSTSGATALMKASLDGHTRAIQLLLEHGAAIDLQDHSGVTALMHASQRGHIVAVQLLLEHGAATDLQDHSGATALMHASHFGRTDIVQYLSDRGVLY
ncbi:Protein TANC1 like protein [Verticillium longisporum]|nr:Protein TANC1 like protein [Verticillium longisporum]